MKAAGAKTNTHRIDIFGREETRPRTVTKIIGVHFKSDSAGETLSLDNGTIMLTVPFEAVEANQPSISIF